MFHGIKIVEPAEGIRALKLVSTAIIGLVVTSGSADNDAQASIDAAFPLDRPVLVTDIRTALATAGEEGTLKPALEAIADQSTPIMVVVRVAEGADAAETETNVVGGYVDGTYSGIEALKAAETELGVRPRILGAPGLDTQAAIEALVVAAKKLRGFVYAQAEGADPATALVYRGNFAHRELMLIWLV